MACENTCCRGNTSLLGDGPGPHAASNDGALDLFCASEGYGSDVVTVSYMVASTINMGPSTLSVSRHMACAPSLVLNMSVMAVSAVAGVDTLGITVTDTDVTEQELTVKALSSRIQEPSDVVKLTRAGLPAGTFTGAMQVGKGVVPGAVDDGVVRLEPGDTLQVIYNTVAWPNPVVKMLRTWVNCSLQLLPRPPAVADVCLVDLGGQLTVFLDDSDQNQDPSTVDTVTVVLRNASCPGAEAASSACGAAPVTLLETRVASGVFTGEVAHAGLSQAADFDNLPGTGSLTAALVSYLDTTEDGSTAEVSAKASFVSPGEIRCASSASGSTLTFTKGDAITITVLDADLDHHSRQPDVTGTGAVDDTSGMHAAVMVYGHQGDLESVQLVETGDSTGIFTGRVQTSVNSTSKQDGSVLTQAGSLLTAIYSDLHPPSLHHCVLRQESAGVISLSHDNVAEMQPVTVTVMDADLNTDAYTVQQTQVNVTDGRAGWMMLDLLETDLDSQFFTALVVVVIDPSMGQSVSSDSENQGLASPASSQTTKLYVNQVNDVISMSYHDTSPPGIRRTAKPLRLGSGGVLQVGPPIVSSVAGITGSHGINITVIDTDLNDDASSVQDVMDLVTVKVESGGSILRAVVVNLTETSTNSSVFTAMVETATASSVLDNTKQLGLEYLQGVSSSGLVVEFRDPTHGVAVQSQTLQTERRGSLSITQPGSDAGRFGIGDAIVVTLMDKDLDVSGEADACMVEVTTNGLGADQETLALTETAPSSGVFTGALDTAASGVSGRNNSVLAPLQSGQAVTATYADQQPLGFNPSETIAAGFIGHITTTPGHVLTSTAQVTITLTDADLDADAASADTYDPGLEYLWYSFDDSDKSYMPLTETGDNTGQFTSVLNLPSGDAARPAGSRLSVTYMDPDIAGKGAVRSALQSNPSKVILAFGSDGAGEVGGFTLSSAALTWRRWQCDPDLNWAGVCGPTAACNDVDMCGPTAKTLDEPGEFTLAAGSALTVTVQDLDQNRDSIAAETVLVSVSVTESDKSVPALGSASNPYCHEAQHECFQGSSHGSPCATNGDCGGGGTCEARGCFERVRRSQQQPHTAVVLIETGLNTGRFSGIIYTQDSPVISDARAGVVNVGAGDILSVTYQDLPSADSASGEARTRAVKILKAGRPARLFAPSTLLLGARLTVTLTDPDLIGKASASVTVGVMSSDGRLKAERETVVLHPSASNHEQPSFRGSLQTHEEDLSPLEQACHDAPPYTSGHLHDCVSVSAPMAGDGILHVQVEDYVLVEYEDEAPMLRVTTPAIRVAQSHVANLTLTPRYPAFGDEIEIVLRDPDLEDTAQVRLSKDGMDVHKLDLQRSGVSPGEFKGRVKIEPLSSRPQDVSGFFSPPPDGSTVAKIYASIGDQVNCTFIDAEPVASNRSVSVRVATPVVVSLSRTLTGGVMDIVVLDPDTVVERTGGGEAMSGQDRAPLTVSAHVSWQDGSGQVTLTEARTDSAMGRFTASLYLSGPRQSLGGLDQVTHGMAITVTYTSAQMLGTRVTQVQAMKQVETSFAGLIRTVMPTVEAGGAALVELMDLDLNLDSSVIEIVSISVATSCATNGSECTSLGHEHLDQSQGATTAVLLETGPSSAMFTGRLLTVPQGSTTTEANSGEEGAGKTGSALVMVHAGQALTLTYHDRAPTANISTQVLVTQPHVLSLNVRALGASTVVARHGIVRSEERAIRQGGSIEIEVVDASRNLQPLTPEHVDVTVSVQRGAAGQGSQGSALNPAYTLTLRETGANSGVFAAKIDLVSEQDAAHAGSVPQEPDRSDSPFNIASIAASAGDEIQVSYGTPPNAVQLLRSVHDSVRGTANLRGGGNRSSIPYRPDLTLWPFSIGSVVSVIVDDKDLNQDVAASEQTTIAVAMSAGSEAVEVRVTEDAYDSSVFTGVVQTTLAGATGAELQAILSQGVLPVTPGALLTAVYSDAAPQATIKSEMLARADMLGTILVAPAFPQSGGVITVYVHDSDLDHSGLVPDTARARVSCAANEDSEGLVLRETSASSGIFTAQLETIQTIVNGVHDSGSLNVRGGAEVLVAYQDENQGILVEKAVTTRASELGELTASRRVALGEALVHASVSDADADLSSAPDLVSVWLVPPQGWGAPGQPANCQLFACDPGHAIALRLVETGAHSGLFTATFDTGRSQAAPNEKRCVNQAVASVCSIDSDCLGGGLCRARHYWPGSTIQLEPGQVTLAYDDVGPDGPVAHTRQLLVLDGLALSCSPSTFTPGAKVFVTLQSFSDDSSPSQDLATVRAHVYSKSNAAHGGDLVGIPIVLKETGGSTSVFTGALSTADGARLSPDELLSLRVDTVPIESGEEIHISTNNNTGRVASARVVAQTQGAVRVSPAALRQGGFFSITVTDLDSRSSTIAPPDAISHQPLEVRVSVLEAKDALNPTPDGASQVRSTTIISLREAHGSPGVFTARGMVKPLASLALDASSSTSSSISAPSPAAPSAVLALEAHLNHVTEVEAGVNDVLETMYADPFPAQQVSAQVHVLESVLGRVDAGGSVAAGAVLTVTVLDEDRNQDSLHRDQVLVAVESQRAGSQQVLTLSESDFNSGEFVGRLLTRLQDESLVAGTGPGAAIQAADAAGTPLPMLIVGHVNESLRVVYNDSAPRQAVGVDVAVVASVVGQLSLSADRIAPGSYLTVTVTDEDAVGGEVLVRVTAASLKEPVGLVAKATAWSSTRFEARFGLRSDEEELVSHSYEAEPYRVANKPVQLPRLDDGEMLTVTYLDHAPEVSVSKEIPVCWAATLELHPLVFGLGTECLIRLYDVDIVPPSTAPEVQATNLDTGQSKTLALQQEPGLAGSFTGKLLVSSKVPTQAEQPATADHELWASTGDAIRVSFQDSCPSMTASVQGTAKTLGSIELSAWSNGQARPEIGAGGALEIVVQDRDLDVLPHETELTGCRCLSGATVLQDVRLMEQGTNSGRFTGRLLTDNVLSDQSAAAASAQARRRYSGRGEEALLRPQDYFYAQNTTRLLEPYTPAGSMPALTAAGALDAQEDFKAVGADIVCEYLDLEPRARLVGKVEIVSSHDARLHTQPQAVLLVGATISVTVYDHDLSAPAGEPSSPAAIITAVSSSDRIEISLAETGAATGIFTGEVPTSQANEAEAGGDAGVLAVDESETVAVMYQEEAPYRLHTAQLLVQRSHAARLEIFPVTIGIGSVVQLAVVDADLMVGEISETGASLTQNVWRCASTGREACIFPFSYKGEEYLECTSRDEAQGRLWCSTRREYEADNWQYCRCFCEGCAKPAVQVSLRTSSGETLGVNVTQAPGRIYSPGQVLGMQAGRQGGPRDVFTGQFLTRMRTSVFDQAQANELLVTPGNLITVSYADQSPVANVTLVAPVMNAAVGRLTASPLPALPGKILFITLEDADVYASTSDTREQILSKTISVAGAGMDRNMVRNGLAGQLVLVDDGSGLGRFTGALMPLFAEDAVAHRQLAALEHPPSDSSSPSLEVVTVNYDDFLTLTYQDQMPVQTVQYEIKIAVPAELDVSDLKASGEMTVTVVDSDLDQSAEAIDTALCHVSLPGRPLEHANLTLFETEEHSGSFTGLVSLQDSVLPDPWVSNVTYLPGVMAGETVLLTYRDEAPPQALTKSVVVGLSTHGNVSTSAVNGNINKGDEILITVVDADLNRSPLQIDSGQVVVSHHSADAGSMGSGSQLPETVTLREVEANSSGIFTGKLKTLYGSLNAAADNGAMDVDDGDHLVVRYRDAAPARTLETRVKVSTAGSISISPPLLDAGKPVTLQVYDYDLNFDAGVADHASVSVESASGDVKQVHLIETGLDTSFFTGAVPTSTNITAALDTLAGVVPDSLITATYVDALVHTASRSATYTATGRVATNGSLVLLPQLITQDLPVTITVTDPDRNRNSSRFETIACQLVSICSSESQSWDGSPLCSIDAANPRELDRQNLTLMETSEASGVFTGNNPTHSAKASNESDHADASLRAPSGALVRLEYFDRNPRPGHLRMTERRVARAGLLYAAASLLNEFASLSITLEDGDLDSSDARDTNCAAGGLEGEDTGELLRNCPNPVRLIGPPDNGTHAVVGYQETGINVLLYETDVHSGIFTGDVETTSEVFDDVRSGIVQAAVQGSLITLTYADQVPAAVRSRVVRVASVAAITTDPGILAQGGNLSITVTDADLNLDATGVETTTVTVSQLSLTPHDTYQLLLTEAGADSALFTGVLETTEDSEDGGDTKTSIYAPPGSFLTVTVMDTHPVPGQERQAVVPVSTRGVIHMECPLGTWTASACSQYDITVTDADLNSLANTAESHSGLVSVYNRRGQEQEKLILKEKGEDSNSFTASLDVLVSDKGDCGGPNSGRRGDGCLACPRSSSLPILLALWCPSGTR